MIKLLGFEHRWAERFRRTLVGGRRVAELKDMERLLRAAAAKRGWREEQIKACWVLELPQFDGQF